MIYEKSQLSLCLKASHAPALITTNLHVKRHEKSFHLAIGSLKSSMYLRIVDTALSMSARL